MAYQQSETWHHSWVGFNDAGFPIMFATVDHHPTIGDLDKDMTDGCARIEKVTDQAERSRLLAIHSGTAVA